MDLDQLIAQVAPTIQRYLTGTTYNQQGYGNERRPGEAVARVAADRS
jgi:hypothetical protein